MPRPFPVEDLPLRNGNRFATYCFGGNASLTILRTTVPGAAEAAGQCCRVRHTFGRYPGPRRRSRHGGAPGCPGTGGARSGTTGCRQNVKELAAGQVCRPQDLAEVPHAALVLPVSSTENSWVSSGKWPQKMITYDQMLRARLAVRLPAKTVGKRTGQRWERNVVLEYLAFGLAPDAFEDVALVGQGDLTGPDAFGLQFMQRDTVLEQHHQQERVDRVAAGSMDSSAGPRSCAGRRTRCRGPCRRCWCVWCM